MFPVFLIPAVLCCCCCNGVHVEPVSGEGVFTIPESASLRFAAAAFMNDTGRACGDFFPTLRRGPTADRHLSGRATLLAKVKGLSSSEALLQGETICADVPSPVVPLVRPVVVPPGQTRFTFTPLGIGLGTLIPEINLGGPFGSRAAALAAGQRQGLRECGPNERCRPGSFVIFVNEVDI